MFGLIVVVLYIVSGSQIQEWGEGK